MSTTPHRALSSDKGEGAAEANSEQLLKDFPRFTDHQIVAERPERHQVSPRRPSGWMVEPECSARGQAVEVATLFLTGRECPYRCLMCDLWKNTLTESVAVGDIPAQITWALEQLPPARAIKLYNSGNFFDRKAVPPADHQAIAELVRGFETVVVENHPKLCGPACESFRDLVAPAQLEVALGLETCHRELLAALNKRMTLEDFDRAVEQLSNAGIRTRAFILLKPPFLEESEGIKWALRSIDHAYDRGVECCAIVPTRAGNGITDKLQRDGRFSPPTGASLERVLAEGLSKQRGRVFVDLWDAEQFFACDRCRDDRIARLHRMNLDQRVLPPVICGDCQP